MCKIRANKKQAAFCFDLTPRWLSYTHLSSPQQASQISAEQIHSLRWYAALQTHLSYPNPKPSPSSLEFFNLIDFKRANSSCSKLSGAYCGGVEHFGWHFMSSSTVRVHVFCSRLCFSLNLSHFCYWGFCLSVRLLPSLTLKVIFSGQFGNRLYISHSEFIFIASKILHRFPL